MKKRIVLVILFLIVLIAILAGIKAMQIGAMIKQGKKMVPPPETVTSAMVKSESWESALTAVGSLTAVRGVTIAAELTGKVVHINVESGVQVEKGDILVRQDISSEEAQLPGAEAQVTLARTVLERDTRMLPKKIVSQADYDAAVATHQQAQAQVNTIRATIAKKTIRAPFGGRLGIRQVNLGQMLREGDPIITLQALDPIYADFSLPQQELVSELLFLGVELGPELHDLRLHDPAVPVEFFLQAVGLLRARDGLGMLLQLLHNAGHAGVHRARAYIYVDEIDALVGNDEFPDLVGMRHAP